MNASHISTAILCGILAASASIPASAQSTDNQAVARATAAPPTAPAIQPARPWPKNVTDVVQLSKAGLSETVVLAFVKNSASSYRLSADDILGLRDTGIPQTVIVAMLQHGDELRQQAMQQVAAVTAAQQGAVPQAPTGYSAPVYSPAPVINNYVPSYQPYDYGSGYGYGYNYSSFYSPDFFFLPTFGFRGRFGGGFSGGVRFGNGHFGGGTHFGNVGFGGGHSGGGHFSGTPFRGFVGHH